jgi:predicted phosphodiesterase
VRLSVSAACLALWCATAPAAARQVDPVQRPAAADTTAAAAGVAGAAPPPFRLFFAADTHSRVGKLDRLVADANLYRPHVVIDGGDIVHDGTEPEFRRAQRALAALEVPWHGVRGNHDAVLRGPFIGAAPQYPEVAAVEVSGWRVILLDNHDGHLDDARFAQLEAELARQAGTPTIVVMHVPPRFGRESTFARLRHLLPYRLQDPVMPNPAQVERFTGLMARHGVAAVLSGHTHRFDHTVFDGVHYIVAGALGGLTPGFGIPGEYLDITIDGGAVGIRRATVRGASYGPVGLTARTFRFYRELNAFNHRELGWNYVPSVSVQLRGGVARLELSDDDVAVASVSVPFERLVDARGRHGFLAEAGLLAGTGEFAPFLSAGYRLRPIGSFERNVYVGAGATGTAGLLAREWTAAAGIQLSAGIEWRHVTLEASRGWLTGHRSAAVILGYRY